MKLDKRHQNLFAAMRQLSETGIPIDAVTLVEELDKRGELKTMGGFTYITNLTLFTPSVSSIGQYIGILKEKRQLRDIQASALRILEAVANESKDALAVAESEICAIARRTEEKSLRPLDADDAIEFVEYFTDDGRDRFPTGFSDLDAMIGGLKRKSLSIIAGRPSMGKTALALNVALNVLHKGKAVAIFSLEQSRKEVIRRMASSEGGVNPEEARGDPNDIAVEWNQRKLMESLAIVAGMPLTIDDCSGITWQEIRSKITRYMLKNPLDLVVIDYKGYNSRSEFLNYVLHSYLESTGLI